MMNHNAASRKPLVYTSLLLVAMVVAVLFAAPAGTSSAGFGDGLVPRTESREEGLENYDIRTDKSAFSKIVGFRGAARRDAVSIADIRDGFAAGENALRNRVPSLKVEYNADLRIPEVIAPNVLEGRNFLTGAANGKRSEILRDFARRNSELIGVATAEINGLKVAADYTNPDGNLSFAHLEQFVGAVPVFRGEIKAGFTRAGEMIRVINNLAPGLAETSLSTNFGDPLEAVRSAARHIGLNPEELDLRPAGSDELKSAFGSGDSATTAEKMYFPTEPGVARAAWRILIWQPVNAYYVIVDAETGTMLWRKNITEDQTQPATYSVYRNSNAMIDVADNPFPLTPGPTSPNGTQGPALDRASVVRIGNEAPYTFNNLGWITDGGTRTDGNAVQAGIDRDGSDGVDANSEAVSASRDFTFAYNPFNPNTNTGDAPVPVPQTYPGSNFQQGTITQLFYISNWYHDELYRLGFTEQARNFQNDNFGRGGVGADRVRAEGQDSSGTNNANFSTPADGGRGRMQMYLWTAPNPDVDGNLDADVVIHELTHGTSNRLHGNGSGLSTNMSRGMGEGWSDFYAHVLLSEPTDPINGIYTTGAYDTYLLGGVGANNYYYAIRRFPKAVLAFTGGPNNRPHNPLTFADVDSTQQNLSDGAFSPAFVGTADQVHNAGEVWSSALWEVRAKFVTRLGWATGNRKALQLVTDGMKLAPLGPTFLQERDAIVAAGQASSLAPEAAADVADIWAGFAVRGMGAGSSVTTAGTGSGTARVVQAFDLPNLLQSPTFTVSDAPGDNDGFPEPGEPLSLAIPVSNSTGNLATNVSLQIVGGGSADYGTIESGQTAVRNVSYTVPNGMPCGSTVNLTFNVNSSLGPASFSRSIIVGQSLTTFSENFDGVTAPAFPAGWTATVVQSGQNFVNSTNFSTSAPNAAFALDPATVGGGTDLTSPSFPVTAAASIVRFRNRFDTEPGWDGGVLEISVGAGAFQDIVAAGGAFLENGYNGALGAGTNNPLSNRNAWSGNSGGFVTTTAQLPASAAGQSVRLRWRFGADDNTVGQGPNPGWSVDDVTVAGDYACSYTPNSVRSRADFDGDGKTDVSVFRGSEGNWYLNRSTAGFTAVNFGLGTDTPTPADWDGDNKTDPAVFRPVAASGSPDFWILQSSTNTIATREWGTASDVPQVGDYDGDNKTDAAVFRPSTNTWFILNSGGGATITGFGASGDIPVVADYDGDAKTDIAIFRPGANQWWIARSSGGVTAFTFGLAGDRLVPADYDGDNKDDVAIYRPSVGQWWILQSSNGGAVSNTFGNSTDTPVPGDYDGDGKDDQAVYRSGNGQWWLNRSTAGVSAITFGIPTDVPVPARYIPAP
jgi:hypothetical protein